MRTKSEIIDLRPTSPDDLADLMVLWNDGRIMRWVGFPDGLGYDIAAMTAWYERLQANPLRHHFTAASDILGFCGEAYYAVNLQHRRAGLDIKLRVPAQGGGRATAAFRMLIERVFRSEPLVDIVWTEPAVSNLAARTLYWQCGLRPAQRPADMSEDPRYDVSYWELRREDR